MTVSVQQMVTDILYAVDDPNQARFSNAQLLTYINEGQTDVARRAEVIQAIQVIPITNNVRDYIAPIDTLRVYKLEFANLNNQQIWPLEYVGLVEMDSIWGINQFNTSAWPQVFTSWQNPPNVLIRLYPVPGQAGTLTCYYYRLPRGVNLSDNIDLPSGWEDLVRDYAEYLCKRADADPTWVDAKKLYEDKLMEYIERSRKFVDAPGRITTGFNPYAWYSGIGGFE